MKLCNRRGQEPEFYQEKNHAFRPGKRTQEHPSHALRHTEQNELVVVMNRERPSALLLNFDEKWLRGAEVSAALATALFRDGSLPLPRAAKVAELSLVDFMQHLSRIGIPIVRGTAEETETEMETLASWLKSS